MVGAPTECREEGRGSSANAQPRVGHDEERVWVTSARRPLRQRATVHDSRAQATATAK